MESIQEILSPDQIDAILATYDSIAIWVSQLTVSIQEAIDTIVVDDVIL